MNKRLLLDTNPLGKLAHPDPGIEIVKWSSSTLAAGYVFLISEIADYELRRSFTLERLHGSIAELDRLAKAFEYVPITTAIMRRAAHLWAEARQRGRPTADPKELDADVILASQAIELSATVVTENIGHLSQFVAVRRWRDI